VCANHAKKNELQPWRHKQWVIPQANADFVCAMEDVLEVYKRPYDPARPVVCLDETSKQLIGETRTPIPAEPGQLQRIDYEYERKGTANLFMIFEPLAGRRWVEVTQRRTAVDFAAVIRRLADEYYPGAQKIVLVMDNLNTHKLASLYEAFTPEEARRLAERLEIHYTPKHGSWLDMAETELSVLARQCLNRRIDSLEVLIREIRAWEKQRNEAVCKINWRFTTKDARIKLKRLYPSFQLG
jgi:DDE superfamily endonuclease